MGAEALSSRAIIGEIYRRLAQNEGMVWVPGVSMEMQSNQESETYKWLGMSPAMREWVGGRIAKGFRSNGITITNKHYEATLEVLRSELRRDKTGQILVRIAELARRTNAHWASLLSTLILANGLCYDGQNFFDTDHSEGDSGSQSNAISVDITTTTAPTAADMESAILQAVQKMMSFVDDQGEPMNEDVSQLLVMVPTPFMAAAAAALQNPVLENTGGTGARTNTLTNLGGFSFALAINPRLTWTTKFAVFRTDSSTKAFIRQNEEDVKVEAIVDGSEEVFKNDRYLYGVSAWRNVGYGFWQDAVQVTFT